LRNISHDVKEKKGKKKKKGRKGGTKGGFRLHTRLPTKKKKGLALHYRRKKRRKRRAGKIQHGRLRFSLIFPPTHQKKRKGEKKGGGHES